MIFFERGLGEDKKWRSVVSIAEVKDDRLLVSELHEELPELTEVQDAVRNGERQELSGTDRPSEP